MTSSFSSSSIKVSIHASSREDATSPATELMICNGVSIHASSREDATKGFDAPFIAFLVSIHASSREDATPKSKHNDSVLCFNPRVLAGGRDAYLERRLER